MPDTRALILDLTRQGHGVAEIARRLRVAQSTVHHHLRQGVRTINAVPPAPVAGGARRDAVHTSQRAFASRHRLADGAVAVRRSRAVWRSRSPRSPTDARRLGEVIDRRCARRYDWRAVQALPRRGTWGASMHLRMFGFSSETWPLGGQAAVNSAARVSVRVPIEVVFAAGTPRSRGHLKKRLHALGLRTDQCERCSGSRVAGRAAQHGTAPRQTAIGTQRGWSTFSRRAPTVTASRRNFAGERRATRGEARRGRRLRLGVRTPTRRARGPPGRSALPVTVIDILHIDGATERRGSRSPEAAMFQRRAGIDPSHDRDAPLVRSARGRWRGRRAPAPARHRARRPAISRRGARRSSERPTVSAPCTDAPRR